MAHQIEITSIGAGITSWPAISLRAIRTGGVRALHPAHVHIVIIAADNGTMTGIIADGVKQKLVRDIANNEIPIGKGGPGRIVQIYELKYISISCYTDKRCIHETNTKLFIQK